MIELEFLGGARTVTGSKHLVRTSRATVLLDCGLFQGHRREANERNRTLGVEPAALDAVVLSHAHIDHSGALPVLVHKGYEGPIYATPATRDLCAPMLEDSAALQEADARHIDRLIARGVDLEPVTPLYDQDDVVATIGQIVGIPYHRRHRIAEGIDVTLLDAGHVLGSAIVVLDITDADDHVRLAFTGDLGRPHLPILRDPEHPEHVHVLLTESTYGDRLHGPIEETSGQLADAIGRTVARGGKVIIPSFALERAQEVLYELGRLRAAGRLPPVPVYVDSPLTVKLTQIFELHPDCYRAEARALARASGSLFDIEGLREVTEVDASKAIDASPEPAIIIAGSGMCEGGRVLHHLRASIESPRNTVVIVGFQAVHTLGRRIAERRREVKIFGVTRDLNAEVVVLDGFSAHADQRGLLAFAQAVREAGDLERVLLVHGEPTAQDVLAGELETRGFAGVHAPAPGERIRLR